MGRDESLRQHAVILAPVRGQKERCRWILGGRYRCTNSGFSFPNHRIGGEPLVICGEHADAGVMVLRPGGRGFCPAHPDWVDETHLDNWYPTKITVLNPGQFRRGD